MQSFSPPLNDQDHDITQNLRSGGNARRWAEATLFRKYIYYIREGRSKYSISEEESFDAYTDAVLSAIETITKGKFENRSSLKTYLYKIFQNKCVDLIRKKTTNKMSVHRAGAIDEMLLELSDETKPVIQQLIDQTDAAALKAALASLGEKCMQLLQLFSEGFSDREIADVAGYKTGEVVKTSRMRCLTRLRALYKT
jgi:RNA polymerase sigma factor (sigma-70 family)